MIKMVLAKFIYKGILTYIDCELNEKMKSIIQKFKDKKEIDIENRFFYIKGKK